MSQGGYLSLRAALAHPELVQGLILIDTQAGTENPELMPYYQQLLERWLTQGMDDELAATIEAIILGQGYDGAERWKSSWKQLTARQRPAGSSPRSPSARTSSTGCRRSACRPS